MQTEIVSRYEDLSKRAAQIVIDAARRQPCLVLALPSGGTPLGMYENLARAAKSGDVDFSRIRLFDIDTYAGLPASSPHTNRNYVLEHLVSRVNVNESRWHPLESDVHDFEAYAARYESAIRSAGGLDLVLDGLGHNGHLGYNEPGASFGSRTRLVKIAERTRSANARFFPSLEDVPHFGLTLGIGTIIEASQIVILASGTVKSDIVRRVVEGPITDEVPMTAIRRHRHAILLVDEDAASRLTGMRNREDLGERHG